MKEKLLLLLFPIIFIQISFAQDKKGTPKLKLTGIGIETFSNYVYPSIIKFDDFMKSIKEPFTLLSADSVDYLSTLGRTSSKRTGIYVSFNSYSKKPGKHNQNREIRLGISYNRSWWQDYFSYDELYRKEKEVLLDEPYLTITRDTLAFIQFNMYDYYEDLSLMAEYRYSTACRMRLSFSGGVGFQAGYTIWSVTYNSKTDYQSGAYFYTIKNFPPINPGIDGFPSAMTWKIHGTEKMIEMKPALKLNIYVPAEVNFRLSKSTGLLSHLNLNLSGTGGYALHKNIDGLLNSGFYFGYGAGMKYSF